MKKRIFKNFAIIVLLSQISIVCFAGELTVEPNGTISTIEQALTQAQPHDTIYVNKALYREGNIVIGLPVTLIGVDWPVIDGENAHEVLTVTADSVTIKGFTIRNAAISYIEENAAIKVKETLGCIIDGNRLLNNFFGVYMEQSEAATITNNEISSVAKREANSGNGIHLWYCKSITIRNNRISGHRDGIYFEFVEHSKISGNISEHNLRYGLHFMFSNHCRYTKNTFRSNGAGVAVMYTHNVEMVENIFAQNWGSASFGLLLKEITDSEIRRNLFWQNTLGVYTEGSNRLQVNDNVFAQNGWAVRVMANSMQNHFAGNQFLENSFHVATNSRQNFNTFEGNYWSAYRGYDLNRDGIGDVPFRPVRLFSLIVEKQSASLILLRSFFIDMLDLAEQMLPMLTPETLIDRKPMMKRAKWLAEVYRPEAMLGGEDQAKTFYDRNEAVAQH